MRMNADSLNLKLLSNKIFARIKKMNKQIFYGDVSKRPFYQIYQYKGNLPKVPDGQGLIDFDLGIFYNRIPKAGNTTIVSNIYSLKYSENVSVVNLSKSKKMFTKPSQLSDKQLSMFDNLFKFTIVRNPFTRILSAYLQKIITGKQNYLFVRADSRVIPTFYEFCMYLKYDGLYQNKHWAPQVSLLLLPVQQYDYIGHLENLNNDCRCPGGRICNRQCIRRFHRYRW